MASQYVGVVMGGDSGRVYAVVNPDHDGQLDNPRFLLLQNDWGEPIKLLKVTREAYMTATSMEELGRLAIAGQ